MIRPFAFLRAAILATSLLAAVSVAAADVQLLTEGPRPGSGSSALKDGTDVPCSLTVENIFTDDEDNTVTPGLHASFKLDKEGESLALVDTDANLNLLLDSTTFGPLGADKAWARPAASPTLFQIQAPSPGAANP